MSEMIQDQILEMGKRARKAARALMGWSTEQKNEALTAMAAALERQAEEIRAANLLDVEAVRESGIPAAMIDRLTLTDQRVAAMIQGLRDIVKLPDPVGRVLKSWDKENGLHIEKTAVPIGVIGMIYESRPNVTADAAALCLKASNAIILRGGSEALQSNQAIAEALQEGGRAAGLPEHGGDVATPHLGTAGR